MNKKIKILLCSLFILFTGIIYSDSNIANAKGFHSHTSFHEGGTHEGIGHESVSKATHDDETANTSKNHNMSDDEMSDNANDDASDKDIDLQTKINHNDNKGINNNEKYGKYNEIKKPDDSSKSNLPHWYFVSNDHLNNSDSDGYYHNRLHELKRYYNRIKITKNIPNPVKDMDLLKKQSQVIVTPENVYSNYYHDIYPDVPIVIANSDVGKKFINNNHLNFDNESMIFNKVNGKMKGHVIEPVTTKYQNHIKEEIQTLAKKIKRNENHTNIFTTIIVILLVILLIIWRILKFIIS